VDAERLAAQVRALDEGRAFVDGAGLRIVLVSGSDAARWLNDLVTARIDNLDVGTAVRSLLLTPTGRIRADIHVWRIAEGFLLLQPTDQPTAVDALLTPYILSSDVRVEDRSESLPVAAFPGDPAWRFAPEPPHDAPRADAEALDAWRIRCGIARFPVDLDEDSLPSEAGLDGGPVIDGTKGCYLGQESVAKVRNLGHPPRVVLALSAQTAVAVGEPVLAGGADVGAVTSANTSTEGSALIVRVRWDARDSDLRIAAGTPLRRR
jgi:folate-binding protein YgfZ